FFPITSSIRYFVEPGNTSPATRLMAINAIPSSRIPRRGWISAHISGSELQFTFFLGFFSATSPEPARLDERSPEAPLTAVGVYVERKDMVSAIRCEGYLFDARMAKECTHCRRKL